MIFIEQHDSNLVACMIDFSMTFLQASMPRVTKIHYASGKVLLTQVEIKVAVLGSPVFE